MSAHDLSAATWRKSSRSNGNGGNNCVEVAHLGEKVAVRDSQDPEGPALRIGNEGWADFLDDVKRGGFDVPV